MKNGKLPLACLLAASVLLGGCAVGPTSSTHYYETVRVAPPPPYVEYAGPPPVSGYVWITGYWNWGGARYIWVPGRWDAPRPGYRWVPHRWERDGDHWRQHEGRWEHAGGASQAPAVRPSPRQEHHEVQPPQRHEAPRDFNRDGHRDGFRDGRDNDARNAPPSRPMPERNHRQPGPHEAGRGESPVAPRVEPPRPVERHEIRPAPEDQRRGDTVERGRGRDERERNDGHDRGRGRERGNERERERGG